MPLLYSSPIPELQNLSRTSNEIDSIPSLAGSTMLLLALAFPLAFPLTTAPDERRALFGTLPQSSTSESDTSERSGRLPAGGDKADLVCSRILAVFDAHFTDVDTLTDADMTQAYQVFCKKFGRNSCDLRRLGYFKTYLRQMAEANRRSISRGSKTTHGTLNSRPDLTRPCHLPSGRSAIEDPRPAKAHPSTCPTPHRHHRPR